MLISVWSSEARPEGGKFVFEVRSDVDLLNQTVGRTIVNNCDADFGDTRCGVVPESITGTVTAVTSGLKFTVSFIGSYANAYFNLGMVRPLTGANIGCPAAEIFSWGSSGAIELFYPLVSAPAIGDTFKIEVGCSKAQLNSDPTVRTCKFYNNVTRFRGCPEVPGSNQVMQTALPGG